MSRFLLLDLGPRRNPLFSIFQTFNSFFIYVIHYIKAFNAGRLTSGPLCVAAPVFCSVPANPIRSRARFLFLPCQADHSCRTILIVDNDHRFGWSATASDLSRRPMKTPQHHYILHISRPINRRRCSFSCYNTANQHITAFKHPTTMFYRCALSQSTCHASNNRIPANGDDVLDWIFSQSSPQENRNIRRRCPPVLLTIKNFFCACKYDR
jgi:hypothetical protein